MENLKFLGIGGACNLEFGGNCAYLKKDNSLMIVDCAEGITEKLVSKNILNKDTKDLLIVITHTHADHVGGVGTLIWYCSLGLGFCPRIFCNSNTFKNSMIQLLDIFGVNREFYSFTEENDAEFFGVKIKALPVSHEPTLECFAILFEDKNEKVIYSGDTNDIDFIRKQAQDPQIKRIYSEVSLGTYPVHLFYNDLKTIKQKEKFVLMHFNSVEDYDIIKKENLFKVATID